MFTTEECKKFTAYADNLERVAAKSISKACEYLSKMEKDDLARFKNWSESQHSECFQFIDDYEKGVVGVNTSHIFWN